jgi:hypothetical protein
VFFVAFFVGIGGYRLRGTTESPAVLTCEIMGLINSAAIALLRFIFLAGKLHFSEIIGLVFYGQLLLAILPNKFGLAQFYISVYISFYLVFPDIKQLFVYNFQLITQIMVFEGLSSHHFMFSPTRD